MKTLPAKKANRLQIVGYIVATVVLAVIAALAISIFFYERKTLKLAVGPKDGVHYRFAEHLAEVVRANSRSIQIKLVPVEGQAEALGALNKGDADLAITRSEVRIPSVARAVANIETEVFFVATPKAQKLSSLAALRGKRIAIQGTDPQNEALVRRVLDSFDLAGAYTLQAVSSETPIERLFAPPATLQAIIGVSPLSKLTSNTRHETIGRRLQAVEIAGVDGGKALERKVPGLFSETISAGMISAAPRWPADDMDTISVRHFLLARARLASGSVTELTRIIFENKEDLGLANEFATHIETPDKEKDAFILAHQGAADFVEDDVKSFLERYSDLFYIGTTAAGIFGSMFLAIYTWLTKVVPVRVSEMVEEISAIAKRAKTAETLQALDVTDAELEELLKISLDGLHSGALSSEGLDVFRLAYDNAHRAIANRRSIFSGTGAMPATSSLLPEATPAVRENVADLQSGISG